MRLVPRAFTDVRVVMLSIIINLGVLSCRVAVNIAPARSFSSCTSFSSSHQPFSCGGLLSRKLRATTTSLCSFGATSQLRLFSLIHPSY